MRLTIVALTALALVACNKAEAPADTNVADTNATADANAADANAVATPAAFQLNETSWTYSRKGKKMQESIDASGNYIVNSGSEHARSIFFKDPQAREGLTRVEHDRRGSSDRIDISSGQGRNAR